VINVSHLAEKIKNKLGDGRSYDVNIQYSEELPPALETGGGIMHALPLLGEHAFILINGDIWTDYPLASLVEPQGLAHLVMVNNPPQHPDGDFVLNDGLVLNQPEGDKVTYSGIGVYRPDLFSGCTPGRFPLSPVLKKAMLRKLITGELYTGSWHDIGTLDRLQHVREILEKVD
ncbi:MAG: mannose-1-phosphate guanylyltransferase, partial [Gammaproteobacteria bacterium]|nr:mannose-1-phosphate guanylyltransferase [Gammaproteobacteria bacterium]